MAAIDPDHSDPVATTSQQPGFPAHYPDRIGQISAIAGAKPRTARKKHRSFSRKTPIRCADFFAGIGGIRLGVEQACKGKVRTVYANDFDKKCAETYNGNFDTEMTVGDITETDPRALPDFDLMLAGFPCQAFSQAGFKKGFEDARGTLFFDIAKILASKRPRAFLLENVASMVNHDKGRTFATIKHILKDVLGYNLHHQVLNSRHFGVPQNRPRVYLVGFDSPTRFEFPTGGKETRFIKDILESDPPEYTYLSQQYYEGIERHRRHHEARGNGFGYIVLDKEGVANSLVLGGMGKERNLVKDKVIKRWRKGDDKLKKKNTRGIRRLTIREYARCQGFPDDFDMSRVARVHAYRQIANSVSVPVVKKIAEQIIKVI